MTYNRNKIRKKEKQIARIFTHTPHTQLKEYIKEENKINNKRAALYQEVTEIERFLNFLSPDQRPMDTAFLCNQVSPAQIYDYVIHKRKGTAENVVSPRTAAVRLSIIRKFYIFLVRNSMKKNLPALRDPTISIKVPKIVPKADYSLKKEVVNSTLRSVISGDQISGRQREAWEKTRYRDLAILVLLLNTGLSLSQIVNLNIEDVFLGYDTAATLQIADTLSIRTELSADEYLLNTITGKTNSSDDICTQLFEPGSCLLIFSDIGQRKLHLNHLASASLLFYLLLEREALVQSTGALFLSLQNRRISEKALENMVAKYFKPFSSEKVTPELIRKTYADYILKENAAALPVLAHRMGYQNTNYLKARLNRNAETSESLDKSIGSLDIY